MHGADPPGDLEELCRRARLDEGEAAALARAGALRGFIPDRRRALWQAPFAARTARARWLPGVTAGVDPPVALPALSELGGILLDADALGLSAGRHVLAPLRPTLAHRPALRISADLGRLPAGQAVEVAGLVAARQRPGTARGVVFLSLSDEEGLIDVVVMPEVYDRDRAAVRGEALLWVEGILERRHGVPAVRAAPAPAHGHRARALGRARPRTRTGRTDTPRSPAASARAPARPTTAGSARTAATPPPAPRPAPHGNPRSCTPSAASPLLQRAPLAPAPRNAPPPCPTPQSAPPVSPPPGPRHSGPPPATARPAAPAPPHTCARPTGSASPCPHTAGPSPPPSPSEPSSLRRLVD